jgi:hypothetical protein
MPHPCQFIVDGCELEVNLDSRTRTVLVKRVREGGVDITIFDTLQASAEKQMIGDSLPRCVACWPVFVPQLLCALGPGVHSPPSGCTSGCLALRAFMWATSSVLVKGSEKGSERESTRWWVGGGFCWMVGACWLVAWVPVVVLRVVDTRCSAPCTALTRQCRP